MFARQILRYLYRDLENIWIFFYLYFFRILIYIFFQSINEYIVDGIDGSPRIIINEEYELII